MRATIGGLALAFLVGASGPALAQFGGAGGLPTGTGDAAAQNLPSTVGVGRQTGNGYYIGVGGGEPFGDRAPVYGGRSAYRARHAYPIYPEEQPFYGPRVRGYGYGFGRYPY